MLLCSRQITSTDKRDICKVGEIGLEDESSKVFSKFKIFIEFYGRIGKIIISVAIAFGLLNMPHGATIRVVKNL